METPVTFTPKLEDKRIWPLTTRKGPNMADRYTWENDPTAKRIPYGTEHFLMGDITLPRGDAAAIAILTAETPEVALAIQDRSQQIMAAAFGPLPDELADAIEQTEVFAPGLEPGEPDVRMVIVRPKGVTRRLPVCILGFGGGMVMGAPEVHLAEAASIATKHRACVVLPAYRLLPRWKYPAAVNDMEATYNYLVANANELNVNPKRIIAYGGSAGGYVALCLAHRLQMRGGSQLCGVLGCWPVLDDTFKYPSSNIFYGEVWHPTDDQMVFNALLGTDYYRALVPADAVPIHCKDFTGFPPTVLMTGELDYGHDPVIEYAQGIMNAGIYCDLHVLGGCFHGFLPFCQGTEIFDRASREIDNALSDLLSGNLVRTKE